MTDDMQARAAQWVADHLPSEARQIVTDLLEALREKDAALADKDATITDKNFEIARMKTYGHSAGCMRGWDLQLVDENGMLGKPVLQGCTCGKDGDLLVENARLQGHIAIYELAIRQWRDLIQGTAKDARQCDGLLNELQNIAEANPSAWDSDVRDQFQQWAQSRAKTAIRQWREKLEQPEGNSMIKIQQSKTAD